MPQCVNCRQDINFGAIICPYCHGNPYAFMSSPYQQDAGDTGPGLLASLFPSLFGPRKRKLAANETEYTVIDWNVIPPRKMKKCKTCGKLADLGDRYCVDGCRKTFVDPE
jgi:hypothetical protein